MHPADRRANQHPGGTGQRPLGDRVRSNDRRAAVRVGKVDTLGGPTAKLCVLAIWRHRHSPSKGLPDVRV